MKLFSLFPQNLKLLIEDIETKKQKIVLWNWKHSIEVVCRGLSPKMQEYFHYEDDMESLLRGKQMLCLFIVY